MTPLSSELVGFTIPFYSKTQKPYSNSSHGLLLSHNRSSLLTFSNSNPNNDNGRSFSSSGARNLQTTTTTDATLPTERRQQHSQSLGFRDTQMLKIFHRSCRSGNYIESLHLLETMVRKGYNPDVILCTKLIKGFFTLRNIPKAVRVMEILEKFGQPDVFAYNALINGFCKMNRIDDATRVLDRMRSKDFSPDTVTYNIMIGSLCSRATMLEGGVDEALKLMDEMLSRGLKPDMFTYNTIIRGMCKEGMVDRAFEMVRNLELKGCEPDVISYNILLRALLNQGKWEEEKEW